MGIFNVRKKPMKYLNLNQVTFVIGAPDSDYELISRTSKLLGLDEYEKSAEIERINYDLFKVLKVDLSALHLFPDAWEANELLNPVYDAIKDFARRELVKNQRILIASSNLSRTANLWASCLETCGIEVSFIVCFNKPVDNFLPWLIYNLDAEKNTRRHTRTFIHIPDFMMNWRKTMRRASSDLDYTWPNWLSTTREQEVEEAVTTKSLSRRIYDKKPTPLNVRRLYSALVNAANGKKYDESVTEEILPDIKLFFAPIIQKNQEIHDLKTRLSKVEDEVVDLRDRMLQPDDDMYEPALEDGTINKAREQGIKLYLELWQAWAQERKDRQDFFQYPLFSKGAPLIDELAELAADITEDTIRILDVMSPPITTVGTALPGKNIEVVATSPFADEFNAFLADAGITPPVPVAKVDPEELLKTFGPKSMDIIHCREAIEYTKNPVMALTEMLAIMKDGGAIFLSHQVNKASEENFQTLAQWNCVEKGGQFIIWNSWYKFNISRMLAGIYDVHAKSYVDFIEVTIRRKK